MTEYTDIDHQTAQDIVQRAKAEDLAIRLDRIGATPYLYHTPYTNNDGVTVNMWSCISYSFRAMPGQSLLVHPTVIKPEDYDDWEVRIITDEWLIHRLMRSRIAITIPKDDSPFEGNVVGGWND